LASGFEFCPSLWGGKDWPSAAYSQKTRFVYVPANEISAVGSPAKKCRWFRVSFGSHQAEDIGLKVVPRRPFLANCRLGSGTGKKGLAAELPQIQLFGSVTATRAISFWWGGTNDRMFRAYHAKTGEKLWSRRPTPHHGHADRL